MRKAITLLLGGVILSGVICHAAEMTGKKVMEEQRIRHRLRSEQTTTRMVLADRKGRTKERVLRIHTFTADDHLCKIMTKFLAPADIRNVGLLTWEQGEDRDDDQWLYLPALKKVKRITSSGKKRRFMGTDLTFEDLRPENISTHEYRRLEDTTVAGRACHVIEALPATDKERKSSGYSRRILYVRKDILITIKTEYFGRKNEKIKLATVSEIENVKDDAWRAKISVVTDMKRGSSTTIKVEERDIDTVLEDSFFARANLRKQAP